jgi:hypothetical protein
MILACLLSARRPGPTTLVLFDVTTLYCETDTADGVKRYGRGISARETVATSSIFERCRRLVTAVAAGAYVEVSGRARAAA